MKHRLLSVALFDFLFVPPRLTFAVQDTRYLRTFIIMLVAALLISNLTIHIQRQAQAARERERRTRELYVLSRVFGRLREVQRMCRRICRWFPTMRC